VSVVLVTSKIDPMYEFTDVAKCDNLDLKMSRNSSTLANFITQKVVGQFL